MAAIPNKKRCEKLWVTPSAPSGLSNQFALVPQSIQVLCILQACFPLALRFFFSIFRRTLVVASNENLATHSFVRKC